MLAAPRLGDHGGISPPRSQCWQLRGWVTDGSVRGSIPLLKVMEGNRAKTAIGLGATAIGLVLGLLPGVGLVERTGIGLLALLAKPRQGDLVVVLITAIVLVAFVAFLVETGTEWARLLRLCLLGFIAAVAFRTVLAAAELLSILQDTFSEPFETIGTGIVALAVAMECLLNYYIFRWCLRWRRLSIVTLGLLPPITALILAPSLRLVRAGLMTYALLLALAVPRQRVTRLERLPYVIAFALIGLGTAVSIQGSP